MAALVRLQICVCLIRLISPHSNGVVQIQVGLELAENRLKIGENQLRLAKHWLKLARNRLKPANIG